MTGGILGRINKSADGIILNLAPDEETVVKIPVLGFGRIDIVVTVDSETTIVKGFVLFFLVIILP